MGEDPGGGGPVAAAVVLVAVHGERWIAGPDPGLDVAADAQQPFCCGVDQFGRCDRRPVRLGEQPKPGRSVRFGVPAPAWQRIGRVERDD